jgi:hypothetical protein
MIFFIFTYCILKFYIPKEAEGCFCDGTKSILLVSIESDALEVVTMELLVGINVTVFAPIPPDICSVTGFPATVTASYKFIKYLNSVFISI